ncbi:MAG: hypothetical protein QOH04_2756 [Sphingomonadales bacterium]|nr:hypothetical protein [Sphingomonadales bacterium]
MSADSAGDSSPTGYSNYVAIAIVASLGGTVANFFVPQAPLSLFVNAFCLFFLHNRAIKYARERVGGFDPIAAAEGIVAFGVFSLVIGLASVACRYIFGFASFDPQLTDQLGGFFPFVEGLMTAGFAPLFAIFLRLRIAELESGVDTVGDLLELSRATADLTQQMVTARKAIETFGSGADAAGRSTVGLASTMKSEADKWGLALQEGQAHVKTFGAAAKDGSVNVAGLAEETHKLKSAAADATKLLDELARLIASVERFVAPRAKA